MSDARRVELDPSRRVALAEAALALHAGAPLRALELAGRGEGALGSLLRGIAYAQLGDYELSKKRLEEALETTPDSAIRTRASAALVEVVLSLGDPKRAAILAEASIEELERSGDTRNAALQRLVLARAETLLGRLGRARHFVAEALAADLPPELHLIALVGRAEIGVREGAANDARIALAEATELLVAHPHPLLARTIESLDAELSRPVARLVRSGEVSFVDLLGIEALSRGDVFLVDGCRALALAGRAFVPLAKRRILLALLLELARRFPGVVPREELAKTTFDVRVVNATHRSRLRVEIGRLRKLLEDLEVEPVAKEDGYALASRRDVAVLLPISDDAGARLGLLLGDGAAWSAQSLADHAGISKRTAQRLLAELVESGAVFRSGNGKEIRYSRPESPIASRMLLLGLVPKA